MWNKDLESQMVREREDVSELTEELKICRQSRWRTSLFLKQNDAITWKLCKKRARVSRQLRIISTEGQRDERNTLHELQQLVLYIHPNVCLIKTPSIKHQASFGLKTSCECTANNVIRYSMLKLKVTWSCLIQ